jgi:hypothetical protein
VEGLREYRHSSYWYLWATKARPAFLNCATALTEAGHLADTPAGRKSYADFLAWQAAEGPVGKSKVYVNLSQGWALGTKEFRAALIKDHALAAHTRAWETSGAQEMRQVQWEAAVHRALQVLGYKEADLSQGIKSQPWKVALATFLKETTQASNSWLADRLHDTQMFYGNKLIRFVFSDPTDHAACLTRVWVRAKKKYFGPFLPAPSVIRPFIKCLRPLSIGLII